MAQDIRKLFKSERNLSNQKMPKGHESRFLEKLDNELPVSNKPSNFSFLNFAASIVLLLGLGYITYTFLINPQSTITNDPEVATTKSIGELSPQLKKVEDYYLANINMELSKIKYNPESKELFDGYVERMDELSIEYDKLADELINSGPNESTVTALIDNLKLRLNLLYRLKEKLNELNNEPAFTESQG